MSDSQQSQDQDVVVTGAEVNATAAHEAQELKDLDQAWGDWTDKAPKKEQLKTDQVVADNLRPSSDPSTEEDAFEVDMQDSINDVEPGGTGGI